MSNKEPAPADVKLDVRAYPVTEPKSSTVGFASVTVNDIIAIHGVRVINGENGLFAAMPSAKDNEGKYRDIVHPVTGDLRKQLNTAVIGAYKEALNKCPQEKASVKEQLKEGAIAVNQPKEEAAPEKAAKKTEPKR